MKTVLERLAYALCTHETISVLPKSLEQRNDEIAEVERTWQRFLREAEQFQEIIAKCGLVIALPKQQGHYDAEGYCDKTD